MTRFIGPFTFLIIVLATSPGFACCDMGGPAAHSIMRQLSELNSCEVDSDCIRMPPLMETVIDESGNETTRPIYTIGCMSFVNKNADLTELQKEIRAYYEEKGPWHCRADMQATCRNNRCVTAPNPRTGPNAPTNR